jgi:hypothetical protein
MSPRERTAAAWPAWGLVAWALAVLAIYAVCLIRARPEAFPAMLRLAGIG